MIVGRKRIKSIRRRRQVGLLRTYSRREQQKPRGDGDLTIFLSRPHYTKMYNATHDAPVDISPPEKNRSLSSTRYFHAPESISMSGGERKNGKSSHGPLRNEFSSFCFPSTRRSSKTTTTRRRTTDDVNGGGLVLNRETIENREGRRTNPTPWNKVHTRNAPHETVSKQIASVDQFATVRNPDERFNFALGSAGGRTTLSYVYAPPTRSEEAEFDGLFRSSVFASIFSHERERFVARTGLPCFPF